MLRNRTGKYIKYTLIVVVIVFLTTILVLKTVNHALSRKVCREIRDGTYSGTTIGNGLTYPLWFCYLMSPLTHFDYFDPEIPLVVACQYGNYQAVCDLLANGADPNYTFRGGFTAIEGAYQSCNENRMEIAKKLIEYGADVTKYETGPEAVFEESYWLRKDRDNSIVIENILFLLDNGASLSDEWGFTHLHQAAWSDSADLAKKLIETYHTDPNARTKRGTTPLMMAAKNNCIEAAVVLLDAGADVSIQDNDGKNAYDYAIEKGYTELAELLKP